MYIINNINLRTSYRLKKNSIKKKSEFGRLKVRGEQENWMHVKCLYKLEHRCPWITGKVLSCHMGETGRISQYQTLEDLLSYC